MENDDAVVDPMSVGNGGLLITASGPGICGIMPYKSYSSFSTNKTVSSDSLKETIHELKYLQIFEKTMMMAIYITKRLIEWV